MQDLDLENGTLQVNHSLTHKKGSEHKVTIPKTNSSLRMVSIPSYLLKELKKYKNIKNKERLRAAELWECGEHFFVFCAWNGKPFYPSAPGTWWRRFIKRTVISISDSMT